MAVEIIVLRAIHVLGGLFWVGSGLFSTFYLMPAMREAGPAAGAVMAGLARRRMFVVMPVVAILTILSGVRLMMITSANFSAAYFQSGRGATFAWGGTFAIAAFFIGMLFVRPAGAKAGRLTQEMQTAADDATKARLAAELARVQKLVAIFYPIVTLLLIAAVIAMAVARYII